MYCTLHDTMAGWDPLCAYIGMCPRHPNIIASCLSMLCLPTPKAATSTVFLLPKSEGRSATHKLGNGVAQRLFFGDSFVGAAGAAVFGASCGCTQPKGGSDTVGARRTDTRSNK